MRSDSYSGISPAGYRVLVEPDEIPEAVTPGGIVIPESDREKYQQAQTTGVIRALGATAYSEHDGVWASVGDRVIYDKYTGMAVSGEDGKEYRLINDTQVAAVISDEINLNQLQRRLSYEQ